MEPSESNPVTIGPASNVATATGRSRSRSVRRVGVVAAVGLAAALAVAHRSDDPAAAGAGVDPGRSEPVVDGTFRLPDGSHEMVGYGTVLVADGDVITPHYVTASTCTPGEPFENELDVDHADDDGAEIVVDLVGPTTDYRLRPATDPSGCDTVAAHPVTALDEVFSTHYPFFDERGVDWGSSIIGIRELVDAGVPIRDALADFLIELGDGHTLLPDLDVEIDVAAFGVDGVDTVADLSHLLDSELDATFARIDDLGVDPSGNVAWGHVTGHPETGYVYIGGFTSGDDAREDRDALITALELAARELSAAEHLVVDVRFNAGGYEDLAATAAGFFVDEPTDVYRKWAHAAPEQTAQVVTITPQSVGFDGDVTILTSPITASAAEVFVLAVREATCATIIGLPSFGEFSDAIDWQLPDGTEFTMSMEAYTDLDGNSYEAVGIPVDVGAPFDEIVDVAVGAERPHQP